MADAYSDEDLITDFIAGSPLAFREIFRRFYDKLFYTSCHITRNKEEAKDITSITLQRLFLKHKDFDNLGQLSVFLFVSARNRSLNYLRDLKTLSEHQAAFMDASFTLDADAVQEELDAEYYHTVVKAMEKLPDRARLILQLRYFEGLKNPEIADRLGISINTVKNHLANSVEKLRRSIHAKPGHFTFFLFFF